MIRVVVTGAAGRMGREVVKAVSRTPGMQLVGAVDPGHTGQDIGLLAGIGPLGVVVRDDLANVLRETEASVMVDFTTPHAAVANIKTALACGVRPVVGTTGIPQEEIEEIKNICREKRLGGLIAPNFALGAVLMMHFAGIAARYFPDVEIIEYHHHQKLDAPSGTALQTAEIIARSRQGGPTGDRTEVEKLDGARGGNLEGIRIHSIRLPGFVAHQEVIFGGLGQTLTIRHDSTSRESFMPGVIMAIKKVLELEELVYGLDKLIFG
ncbi:dihydrodipicolinate reductase [Ammonifex degensii KC4]|uniref:4-hydroxy-tetrahydrodipicolinate reductase n=1 Tax=Ammonifex degensii (strain DSM 10501 / KC4) TaxID=429009 RepID=C9RB80_AMMDK|nr:4-hydroxy-tetrahydrodipicolinate reductase [Ammonifex degensii]ACX51507.1 dihydrodipicolinate reductase [Ammonifex degensii KC4]